VGNAIDVVNVSRSFGATQALADISMTVRTGRSHALVGRNGAGKSTLVSIISGLDRPDRGELLIDGFPSSKIQPQAWQNLVTTVYQRPTTFPGMTVAENMMFQHLPRGLGSFINWRRLRAQAAEELERWNIPVSVDSLAGDLTVEQRRLVEIARALSQHTPIVILDEPTAELEGPEVRRLLDKLNELRAQGVTFLYISHHLSEIFDVCDDVTVLRNGRSVLSREVEGLGEQDIVEAMVGEVDVTEYDASSTSEIDREHTILELRGFSTGNLVRDVDLSVHAGEVLGIASQAGSGGLALGRAIAGAAPSTGQVVLDSVALASSGIPRRIAEGVSWVPQDRHSEGFIANQSIARNVTLPVLSRLGRLGFISQAPARAVASEAVDDFEVSAWGIDQEVGDLSGGNQQKTVVARALTSSPQAVVMLRPTQGVDVASRSILLDRARTYARKGNAVLIVSDEPDDLRICDRIKVMFRGRFTAEFPGGSWSEKELVSAMEGLPLTQKDDDA